MKNVKHKTPDYTKLEAFPFLLAHLKKKKKKKSHVITVILIHMLVTLVTERSSSERNIFNTS